MFYLQQARNQQMHAMFSSRSLQPIGLLGELLENLEVAAANASTLAAPPPPSAPAPCVEGIPCDGGLDFGTIVLILLATLALITLGPMCCRRWTPINHPRQGPASRRRRHQRGYWRGRGGASAMSAADRARIDELSTLGYEQEFQRAGETGRRAERDRVHALRQRTKVHTAGEGSAAADGGDECAVCLEPYTAGQLVHTLRCGHRFHAACADRWFYEVQALSSRWCPLCKADPSVDARGPSAPPRSAVPVALPATSPQPGASAEAEESESDSAWESTDASLEVHELSSDTDLEAATARGTTSPRPLRLAPAGQMP